MDLKTYLHTEFEAYPKLFRDVVAFLAKEEVVGAIMEPQDLLSSDYVVESNLLNGGERFVVYFQGVSSGEPQLAPSIAYWQLKSKKKFLSLEQVNPIFKDSYSIRVVKWLKKGQVEREHLFVSWLASLNVAKHVWSSHKKSEDYKLLERKDKLYVDALGVLVEMARKQAVLMLSSLSVDIRTIGGKVKEEEERALDDRKSCFPIYSGKLSPSFRHRLLELLS
jgi:hypothetical protein